MNKSNFVIGQVKALKNLGIILSIEAVALMTVPTAHADVYKSVTVGNTDYRPHSLSFQITTPTWVALGFLYLISISHTVSCNVYISQAKRTTLEVCQGCPFVQ